MSAPDGAVDDRRPPAPRRRPLEVHLLRGLAAGLLLAGLFALLVFVLLPGGDGDGSVPPARLVDTPPGPGDASLGVHPGRLARDFEASNLDGLPVRLSNLRGRPVVVNFWATWCTSCLAEMPVLEEQRRAHQAEDVAIVAVNVGEGLGDARRFIEELELFDFTVAMDPDLTIADAYSVRGLPQSVFIDSSGVIQAEYQGQLDEETMQRYVQAAIDAEPGGEAARRLRLVTTVPRENVLDVLPDEKDPGRVLFISRRFRCDDVYCAAAAVSPLGDVQGVTSAVLRSDEPPQTLSVAFDPDVIQLDGVVALVAEALRAQPDPLYTRELEVRYPEGER